MISPLVSSVVVQLLLCSTLSETSKTGFLTTQLICFCGEINSHHQICTSYEPHHEKTCLWGFRSRQTQAGLYNSEDG